MNPYQHTQWHQFRDEVIKLDEGKCVRCFRSRLDGAVLQVHHKQYSPGRMPWQYKFDECETLCRGCHAEEHGKIMPQSGWEWYAVQDLEDLVGECELCGTHLRYLHLIGHKNWHSMEVGIDCCDRLTGTLEAAEFNDKYVKTNQARKRFVDSTRWKQIGDSLWRIRQNGIEVYIALKNGAYSISMNDISGKVQFQSLVDAKIRAFNTINSGEAAAHIEKVKERQIQRVLDNFKRKLS